MSKDVKISKGANIKLKGIADKLHTNTFIPTEIVLKPSDFPTLTPKLSVKVGDKVKAGSPLFFNKENERILFTSPVSGEVIEINRGEKRKILGVKVKADTETQYESFVKADPLTLSKEDILDNLLKSGVWPFFRQRPYDVIANPSDTPKAIHITALDTNPLAPDYGFIAHGKNTIFQTGLNALTKLTAGKVHLNINGNLNADEVFTSSKNVQLNKIEGPHPAGNVGVQIHHIDPINKGDVVWTLKALDVLTIGKLFIEGKFDASRSVAFVGSKVKKPSYIKTILGANISNIINGNVEEGGRYISGNPLTGTQIAEDGYLGFYDYQLTVIPEGGNNQFFGWMTPGFDKFSLSGTFFSKLMPNKEYDLNTNTNGEERAFVVSGEYEKVFPFDIYPVYLIKSILVNDIEAMENLGIYEVAPEDFALCEYACTSKNPVQQYIRDGLNVLKKEMA
ncbi:MAG: NADH:ubiquinone reductase (Na(+)-transporting) subunit A [Flavobacteriales bacterium CG18_big_fil_WC_8_21_14_2_50_32_9]|nr:MAG: NADH:ubiquinone reductase (Na(+)-transporting) subunit A [Flavobacteriales bacterium CG18_big_fil_WC_8_21_14_2_50_32_9]PJC61381.1 MAG: NADH:ubiquinone reductase (Na(+)-transporting) subunit A [Flavobacteriales bacterium CG_4_9_14_0_2_um_filter_32_27]